MNNPHREEPAPPPPDLAELGSELRRLWHHMMRGVEQPQEIKGLQRQQFWVLGALAEGSRRMSDLAECAQTSQTSLTGIVDRLEEHGLVCRTRSVGDRRVVEVAVTDEGRRVLASAHAAFMARFEKVVEPLSEQEQIEFLRLVRKMTSR